MRRLVALALVLIATNANATMPGWATTILTKHFNESSTQNVANFTFDCQAADPAVSPTGKGRLYCKTGTGLQFSLSGGAYGSLGGGGGGSVNAVGPGCATGNCLTDGVATSGTALLVWEGTSIDGFEITLIMPSANPGSDIDITFPSQTGTLALTTVVPAAYATSAHTHLLGDCTAAAWFDGTAPCNALIFEGTAVNSIDGTLSGGNPTGTSKTWTLPDETGTICTNNASAACLASNYGDADGPATSTANGIVRYSGTSGKILKDSTSTIDDSGNATFVGTVTATEFIANVRTCATNSDCNSIKLSYNSGGNGLPTCANQGEANKYTLVTYDDDTLHICQGTTDLGAWNGGDVTAVGGCTSGACYTNDVASGTSLTWFVFEGNVIDGQQHRWLIPIGEPVTGQAYDWTFPPVSATLATEAVTKYWSPPPGLSWTSGGSTAAGLSGMTDDVCACSKFTLPGKMIDVDDVGVRINIAATGSEPVDFAIYSSDGQTQYMECAIDTTKAINTSTACSTGNDITTPPIMWPGEYWFCFAYDNGGGDAVLEFDGSTGTGTWFNRFTQTCAGGEAPATLTSPTDSMTGALEFPGFVIVDK